MGVIFWELPNRHLTQLLERISEVFGNHIRLPGWQWSERSWSWVGWNFTLSTYLEGLHIMAPLRSPGLKVKLLVGPTCKIPRSTQRSCSGIRRSPKMCQDIHLYYQSITKYQQDIPVTLDLHHKMFGKSDPKNIPSGAKWWWIPWYKVKLTNKNKSKVNSKIRANLENLIHLSPKYPRDLEQKFPFKTSTSESTQGT